MLKYVLPLRTATDIDKNISLDSFEFLVCLKDLSRFGSLSFEQIKSLNSNRELILNWDILLTESKFQISVDMIKCLDLSSFKSIRVQDLGAFHWVIHNTDLPIELNLETGNMNLKGILSYLEFGKNRVSKLILSPQLSSKSLSEILANIDKKIEIELLGFGPILLFYSPRPLVSRLDDEFSDDDFILAHSEESSHRNFPIYENQHGTFMFYSKYQCLLDETEKLLELGVTSLRIEIEKRLEDQSQSVFDVINKEIDFQDFKQHFKQPLIKSFFRSNKSDVLFKKLKNQRLLKNDQTYIGEILDVNKNKGMAFEVKYHKDNIQDIQFITPEGKTISKPLKSLKNINFEYVDTDSLSPGIYIMPYVKGCVPKTVLLSSLN